MKTRIPALLSVLLASPVGVADPAIINGSFESPGGGGGFTNVSGSGGITGWNVTGNIDYIHAFWTAADGGHSLDLNGSTAGGVTQTITTTPGTRYKITYAVSENFYGYSDKTMDVMWDGAVVKTETITYDPARTPAAMKWEYRSVLVTADGGSSTLEFLSTTGAMDGAQGVAPFYGPALDDVSIAPAPPCTGDINADGVVNTVDLGALLGHFGQPVPGGTLGDVNGDGIVNTIDLGILLGRFGKPCP